MADSNMQLQWTDEQWNKVRQVVYEEARRARVAGNVLPLYGPLESDARYVSKQLVQGSGRNDQPITVSDDTSLTLSTIQRQVRLRGSQVSDPDLDSALIAFRLAANYVARREDEIILQGGQDDEEPAPQVQTNGAQHAVGSSGQGKAGLVGSHQTNVQVARRKVGNGGGKKTDDFGELQMPGDGSGGTGDARGADLVAAISKAIGKLEEKNHLGPFACILGPQYFLDAQTPTDSLVLPQDRILPLLGGGALLRTSVLKPDQGLVVALGGAPIDLVVATDISVGFLQVTPTGQFLFRVYEKIALRIKQPQAIALLSPDPDKDKDAA